MLLENKTAVIYGAGGRIGASVARTFAREGARVFLTGRRLAGVETVAKEITAAGGQAEAAQVDALDRHQIAAHAGELVRSGGFDISFNAVSIRDDLQGTRLIDMSVADFTTPVTTAATTHFLTATEAGRHMVTRGSDVILTLSSTAARLSGRDQGFHSTGGFGVACGVVESLTRNLAGELGPQGVRVPCLRPDAIPETWNFTEPIDEHAAGIKTYMQNGTVLRRLPRLVEVAEAAAFLVSDRASAMTGTVANLSCGSAPD